MHSSSYENTNDKQEKEINMTIARLKDEFDVPFDDGFNSNVPSNVMY